MMDVRNLDTVDASAEGDLIDEGLDGGGGTNENPLLDALIDALDEDQPGEVELGVVGDGAIEERLPQNHRADTVSRHLSSSSAKRRILKQSHCNFCREDCNKQTLENHLRTNENCLTLYLRKLHLKTLDAVLLKIYPCLYCDQPFRQLSHHLQTQPECFQQFKARFNVSTLGAVVKKVKSFKREEYKSRRSLERQFENDKAKNLRKSLLQKDKVQDLNKHCQQTAFSNYKKCCNCHCDLTSAEEVTKDTDIVKSVYDFSTFSQHKRTNAYFLCKFCFLKKENVPDIKNSCFTMKGYEGVNDKTVFVPELKLSEPDSNSDDLPNFFHIKNMKVMMPTSIKSLLSFTNNLPSMKLSSFEIQNLLYGEVTFNKDLLGVLYHHQLSKYISLEKFGDLFRGEVADKENRTVRNLEPCPAENNIRGSSKWISNRDTEIQKKMAQFGRFCLFLSTVIPVDHQTVATRLRQRGFVVTTNYNGEANQELDRNYFVHQGHTASRECNRTNCQKIAIEEYLVGNSDELLLTNENVTSYICSVENFIHSFISNVITSPASQLSPQEYHFRVKFDDNGIARLEGLFWPISLQKINLLKLDKSLSDEGSLAIKQEYIEKIESSIAATSDIELLKVQFGLSDADCEKMNNFLAKDQMHHHCGECFQCLNPPMPSLETMLCVTPDPEFLENILVSSRFSKLFKSRLLILDQQNIEATTTYEWSQSILEEAEHEIIAPNCWQIVLEDEEFLFKIDRRLAELIEKYDFCDLMAAYQYSLSCVGPKDENKVILKRPHLSDSYLKPFNPFIAKAVCGSTNLQIITSSDEWDNLIWTPPKTFVRTEQNLFDHAEVSLTEALVLLDNNKLNTKASSVVEFVYTGPNFQKCFRKRTDPVDNCFSNESMRTEFYECLETNVSRFLKRMNGKDLLLCEVATGYDYVGSDKSEELFDVYKHKMDKITDTEEQCVTNGSFYPEYILCNFGEFGHVLKKRRRRKVLNYPTFDPDSFEFKYSQVLLYFNVHNMEDLTKQTVEESFTAVTDGGERVIDRNKRQFLMKARVGDLI